MVGSGGCLVHWIVDISSQLLSVLDTCNCCSKYTFSFEVVLFFFYFFIFLLFSYVSRYGNGRGRDATEGIAQPSVVGQSTLIICG